MRLSPETNVLAYPYTRGTTAGAANGPGSMPDAEIEPARAVERAAALIRAGKLVAFAEEYPAQFGRPLELRSVGKFA